MRHFSETELERMQDTQTSSMQDLCIIHAYSAGNNDYGPGAGSATYTAGDEVVCGYNPKPREVMNGTQVMITDGSLRLPIDTEVSNLDRIQLTHRYGVELETPETFEVLGQPARGPSGLVVNLRMVTDGSGA